MARKGEFSIRIETRRGTLWTPAKIGHLQEFGSLHNTISSGPPFLAKKVGGIQYDFIIISISEIYIFG